ncbi:hypothetical protein [Oerskovia paurometabola]|uniref:hypothetical protein n=1 Tax=Oerskovia paurometabola TaxID=162170 RepID=UPI0034246C6F
MARHLATTTQEQRPWRTTVRTTFQAVLALAALTPFALEAVADGDPAQLGGGAVIALTVAGAITRVMAVPAVNTFLQRFVPWLAAEPAPPSD